MGRFVVNKFQNEINKITKEAKEMFLVKSDRLFLERVRKEHELAKQYSGREILELLQNIDDAYNPNCDTCCEARFELNGNCLTVSNNGNPFTLDTLNRLCQGSVSSKEGKYIGCKGIGFRSVLNWSDNIEIYSQSSESDYIAVRFSSEYAKKRFDEIKDNDHIKSQLDELKQKNIVPSFPIFKAPEPIDPIDKKHDTVIKIYIKDEIISRIEKSIEKFDRYSLLFLPNVKKIVFICNGETTTYSKEINNGCVKIKCKDSDEESFYYFEDDSQTIEEEFNGTNNIRMAVAIPTKQTEKEYNLYTFFPILNIKSPFNALLHATFSLNSNRNNFESSSQDDKINRAVFLKLLEFYVSKVVNLGLENRRLRLLNPNNFGNNYTFPDDLSRLKCVAEYVILCKDKEIFFSVNNKYLKPNDKQPPVLFDRELPEIFYNNENFSRLVVVSQEEKSFAEQLIGTNNNENETYLCNAINSCSNLWETSDRICVFKWWDANKYTSLPALIKNTKGGFIESSESACFLSGSINDIPEWANINILDTNDEEVLLVHYNKEIRCYKQEKKSTETNKRILPRLINAHLINLQEQSSKQVMISPVNDSIDSNNNRAKEYIKWLWEIWEKEGKFENTVKSTVNFFVPTINNGVSEAVKTYMGSEFYENSLGEKLFGSNGDFISVFIPDFIDKNISDEREKFIRFLSDIGVCKYPKISSTKFEEALSNYINYIKKTHTLNNGLNISDWKICVKSTNDILAILERAETATILNWILSDNQLKTQIVFDDEPDTSYVEYRPRIRGQQNFVRWNTGWNLPSYLRYLFSTTEWIKIDGKKYAPNNLMVSSTSNIEGIGCITEDVIENWVKILNTSYEDLKQILQKLGVKESYLDLNSSQFYGLLLQLVEKDDEKSRRISREIYRAVINNNRGSKAIKTAFYSSSEKKDEFFKSGKVLAKNSVGNVEYRNVSDVCFSSSAVLNLDNTYFIDIPPRSGNKDNFKEIFGIKAYEQEYSIENTSITISKYDSCFQKDFKDFLPYLLTYRSGNKTSVCLDIRLVSEISIFTNHIKRPIEVSYSLLKETKSKWYIYVGEGIQSYHNIDKCKVAEALEQIFNVYFNFPAKDFLGQVARLFICTPEQRKYFVESDFGSDNEYKNTIAEITKASEIKQKIKDQIAGNSQNSDELNLLIDKIDWMDFDNVLVQENIVSLLKNAGKSVRELNNVLGVNISIVNYNKNQLLKEYGKRSIKIKTDIYYSCKNKQEYCKLIELWDKFEFSVKSITIGDLYFDPEQCLKELIEKFYNANNIKEETQTSSNMVEVQQLYYKNKETLKDTFQKANLSLNDFTNNPENHSLLYFDKLIWERVVDNFITDCNSEERQENKLKINAIKNVSDILNKLNFNNDLEPGKVRVINNSSKSHGNNGSAVTERNISKKNKESKSQGNQAEYLVILALAEKKISEINTFFNNEEYSIVWKSGAANEVSKAEGDNYEYDTSQVDDGAGYDIELVCKNDINKKMFIEVKSSSSDDCSFFMSANEYNKAKEIIDYRIVFVSNMENEDKKVSFINGSVITMFDAIPTQFNVVYKKESLSLNP